MQPPTVSIITPCFNAATTIGKTIDSVLTQTFRNWEMLIIDDCSTDNSAKIIREYTEEDTRIRYYKTEISSGSPSLPRNIGIENATGQYICFLDADDVWLPEKLEKQIMFIESGDYQFVYSNYEKIDCEGRRKNRIIKLPNKATFWDVIETCTIPCLTVMMRSRIIGDIRFKIIPKEDFIFWLDILKKGIIAYNCNETLALYREQPKSRSSNKWNMIKCQWNLLRYVEGVKPFVAIYFMAIYIFHGFIKYIK